MFLLFRSFVGEFFTFLDLVFSVFKSIKKSSEFSVFMCPYAPYIYCSLLIRKCWCDLDSWELDCSLSHSLCKMLRGRLFVSLFCKSKWEHLWNKEKCFLFQFKRSFRSWYNQILTFQIFKSYNVIKCPSMKHQTHFTE